LMKANQPDTAAKQMSIAITEAGQTFLDNFREVKQAKISPEVVQQLESHIDLAGTAPEKSPDRARAHYNIAFCLFHMGEAAAAMGHLEEAVEHDPAARSDYLATEDFTESVELSQGNQKKKGKKSKRIIDDAEEDLNDSAFNDMDAIARAKMNDAALLASKAKQPSEEVSGSVAESNVADVDTVERKPEAEISTASSEDKQPRMHKSKKLRREAIEKAVFGPATTGGGVIGMSEEDMKVAKDLIPLLKKRAVESSKSRGKDTDLDDDDDEIDAADLPKPGEKIMLMSKEQWQDLEKDSGATKQSKVKVSKKKSLKAVKKSLVAKKVGLKKKVKSVTKKPKSTKPSESNNSQ
jgi:tetratricopeptide (TPR) repeat protein